MPITTINASGLANPLGVGTASPVQNFQILNASGASGTLSLSGSAPNSTGGPSYILMGNSDSAGTSGPNVIVAANRSLSIGLGTSFSAAGGGTVTALFTVNSNGAITYNSLHPIASLTHSLSTAITSDVQLTSANFYDTTILNQGGYFNASTGRFTCPVTGIYRCFVRVTSSGGLNNIRLRKNDVGVNEAYGGAGGDLQTVSSEIVVSCVAGDFLNVQVNQLNTIGGPQHKQVTFHLLG
jgi:hypothetical protein